MTVGITSAAGAEAFVERVGASVVEVGCAPPNAEERRHLEGCASTDIHTLVVRHLGARVACRAADVGIVEKRAAALRGCCVGGDDRLPNGDGVDPVLERGHVDVLQHGAAHAAVEYFVREHAEIVHVSVPVEGLRYGDPAADGLRSPLPEPRECPDVTILTTLRM